MCFLSHVIPTAVLCWLVSLRSVSQSKLTTRWALELPAYSFSKVDGNLRTSPMFCARAITTTLRVYKWRRLSRSQSTLFFSSLDWDLCSLWVYCLHMLQILIIPASCTINFVSAVYFWRCNVVVFACFACYISFPVHWVSSATAYCRAPAEILQPSGQTIFFAKTTQRGGSSLPEEKRTEKSYLTHTAQCIGH